MTVVVNKEFLDRVMSIIEENASEARELESRVGKMYSKACDILADALRAWIDEADEEAIKEHFLMDEEDEEDIEEGEDIRELAKEKLDALTYYEMRSIAEPIARKDPRVKHALARADVIYKRAEYMSELVRPLVDRIMPVEAGKVLTRDNMTAFIVLVYKICKELEKQGIEP